MGKKDRESVGEESQRPDAWEQFRVLIEAVDQGRRVTELVDHKIRYALVLISVVNAAVILLATRTDFLGAPRGLLLGLGLLVVLYMIAMFSFLWYAIQALRPRRLAPEIAANGSKKPGVAGVLFWEGIVQRDLDGYRQVWSRVTMEELNQELIVIAHTLSRLIQAKYAALDRIYTKLFLVLALATVLATAIIGFAAGLRLM